jgi:hypothetical protein
LSYEKKGIEMDELYRSFFVREAAAARADGWVLNEKLFLDEWSEKEMRLWLEQAIAVEEEIASTVRARSWIDEVECAGAFPAFAEVVRLISTAPIECRSGPSYRFLSRLKKFLLALRLRERIMDERAWQLELCRRAEIDELARRKRKEAEEADREWRARVDASSARHARLRAVQQYGMDEPMAALPEVTEEREDLEEEPASRSNDFDM